MILEDETFKKFGYYPRDLKAKSSKRILVKCDECGTIREIFRYPYYNLCRSCSQKLRRRKVRLTEKEIARNKEMICILEEETFEKFGYFPSKLKPKSFRKILVKCIECGKVREIYKEAYRELCQSCTTKGNRNPCYGRKHTEEEKQRIKDNHSDFRGKNHPQWQGGISIEPYCVLFNEKFKERVREFWNRKCVVCGKDEEENGRKVSVHHVTYNKEICCDDSEPLFVTLCTSCHSKTNFNKKHWEKYFKEMIYNQNKNGKCYYTEEEMKCLKKVM